MKYSGLLLVPLTAAALSCAPSHESSIEQKVNATVGDTLTEKQRFYLSMDKQGYKFLFNVMKDRMQSFMLLGYDDLKGYDMDSIHIEQDAWYIPDSVNVPSAKLPEFNSVWKRK